MGSGKGSVLRPSHAGSPMRLTGALLLLFAALVALLTACAPSPEGAANSSLSKLNSAIQSASKQGVPARRLGTIIAQEDNFEASTATGSSSAYQAAANGYSKLYNQVVALEHSTPTQARSLATDDLSSLQTTLATTENSSIADVATAAKQFVPMVPVAQQQLAAAKTTKEYFTVDEFILEQLAAVTQMTPDYNQIQNLTDLVNSLSTDLGPAESPHILACATEGGEIGSFGINPSEFWANQNAYPISTTKPTMVQPQAQNSNYYFSTWPSQALNSFESATNANDFTVLGNTLAAEIATLTADSAPQTLAEAKVAAAVDRFQTDVTTYQSDLTADNSFLAAHRAKDTDVPDYNAVWGLSNASTGFAPPQDFFPNIPNFQLNTQFAKQASADTQALNAATTSSMLSALTKTVQAQEQALSFPLVKVEAYYDTDITLQNLINEGQSTTTNVTFAGVLYKTPNAYEYADDSLRYDKQDTVGIQDAMIRIDQSAYLENTGYVSASQSLANWQGVENEAQMFIHNLSAMITNLAQMPKNNAARIAWSMTSHQTDINLIDYYGLQNSRVIVVSLREQKARLYENGKLVVVDGKPYAFDVTTGSPDKPTVPGIHCALPPLKGPPGGDIFKSSDPPGSPFYYKPTPVHFSFGYSLYGYYMHDGWWRDATEMGYLTNLPHYDPEAFNGGSHGCINFHYDNGDMAKVYAFSYPGIPIIVY